MFFSLVVIAKTKSPEKCNEYGVIKFLSNYLNSKTVELIVFPLINLPFSKNLNRSSVMISNLEPLLVINSVSLFALANFIKSFDFLSCEYKLKEAECGFCDSSFFVSSAFST